MFIVQFWNAVHGAWDDTGRHFRTRTEAEVFAEHVRSVSTRTGREARVRTLGPVWD